MAVVEWVSVQVAGREIRIRTGGELPKPGNAYLWPSVGEYPVYDEYLYHAMLEDEARNKLFRGAIEAAAPGKVVAEFGCGPDLLWSLAAAQAGARRVYAVEVLEDSAAAAEETARAHPQAPVTVVRGLSTEVALPERADLCVAELVGSIAGAEGMVRAVTDAHDRHLAPAAPVIPARVRTMVGAVDLHEILGGEPTVPAAFAPYVEAVLQSVGHPFDLRFCVGDVDEDALKSTTGVLEDLRFSEQSYVLGGELRLRIERAGRIDGLLAWIDLAAAPDGPIVNSLTEPTNWLPVYIPFAGEEPVQAEVGDTLTLRATVEDGADGIHPDYFFDGHLTGAATWEPVPVRAQSRHSGGPFRATLLHRGIMQ